MNTIESIRVVKDFDRSAKSYETYAKVQWQVMTRLLEQLIPYMDAYSTPQVLDVGCGTGWLAEAIRPHNLMWKLKGIDIAPMMVETAVNKGIDAVLGSAEALPYDDNTMEGVFSSMCIQWLEKPDQALSEMYRVLKPGAIAVIGTLESATLKELRESFAFYGEHTRVMEFRSETAWLDMARNAGFQIEQKHINTWRYPYPNLMTLLKTLRGIGASNKRQDRAKNLAGLRLFANVEHIYETHHSRMQDGIWATWQPIILVLKKPDAV